ncbi:MAG: hypothetical protein QOJ08_211 [Ilumatobacteraceae bacterium]
MSLREQAARNQLPYRANSPLLTVGVDIGGTKVAAGVVNREGVVLEEIRRETPD